MSHAWRRIFARLLAMALLIAVSGVLETACGPGGETRETLRYHCPMHPTYVADHPGDCPICGMRLVPIGARDTREEAKPETKPAANGAQQAAPRYVCPMDPEVVSDKPGRCPKCGMALVLAKQDVPAQVPAGLAPITVGEEGLKLAGVQSAEARAGGLRYSLRTVATVAVDERRVRVVTTKVQGFVEKLFVTYTGQLLRQGEPMLALYSPELLAAEEEYLRLREAAKGPLGAKEESAELLRAARRRLELYDVPEALIARLEKGGQAQRVVTFPAPFGGTVTGKGVFAGQQVVPGMELFTVTDLSKVWIEAEVYESEARLVAPGQVARFSLPYDPGREFSGKVAYIYPSISAQSRTLRLRFDLANTDFALKPGMFVNAELRLEAKEGVVIPASAVLDTGLRQVVYVDSGQGRYVPRQVTVGVRHEGMAQILSGLAAGERVVTKGNFLLDSESRLRAAMPQAPADKEDK